MKKILFVQHCAAIGGGSWCLLEIIQEIDRSLYQVEVVLGQDGPLRQELESLGIKVHMCFNLPVMWIAHPSYSRILSFRGMKNFLSVPVQIIKVQRVLKAAKPDVVYLNSIVQFVIGYISKKCGVPCVVLHIREHYCLPSIDPRAFFWWKTSARYIDQILSISESGAELAGVTGKSKIARDWADFKTRGEAFPVDIFKKYQLPQERPMVLLTGGSSHAKGSLNAVRAFLKMEDKKSICVVLGGENVEKPGAWGRVKGNLRALVGKHPDWYKLRKLAKQSDRIFLLPTVLCVKQFMEAAQLIVCVYAIPHCAKPAVEAGMLSKAAIVADNPEGLEYVKDGETGFIVPYGNPELLAQKMDEVLSGVVNTGKMGKAARSFVEKEFSKEKSMKVIMDSILEQRL